MRYWRRLASLDHEHLLGTWGAELFQPAVVGTAVPVAGVAVVALLVGVKNAIATAVFLYERAVGGNGRVDGDVLVALVACGLVPFA